MHVVHITDGLELSFEGWLYWEARLEVETTPINMCKRPKNHIPHRGEWRGRAKIQHQPTEILTRLQWTKDDASAAQCFEPRKMRV
jgi:hypothetical protein